MRGHNSRSDHPGPIGRESEDAELPAGGKCGMK
jgi:hypothetical protein